MKEQEASGLLTLIWVGGGGGNFTTPVGFSLINQER